MGNLVTKAIAITH